MRVQGRIATLRCDVITGVHVAEGDWLSGDANCREVWKIGQLSRRVMEDDVIGRKRWKSWTARFWTEEKKGGSWDGEVTEDGRVRVVRVPTRRSAVAVVQAGPPRAEHGENDEICSGWSVCTGDLGPAGGSGRVAGRSESRPRRRDQEDAAATQVRSEAALGTH